MKKLLTFMLALLLSIAFVACSSDTPKKKAEMKPAMEKKMCVPAPGEICPAV